MSLINFETTEDDSVELGTLQSGAEVNVTIVNIDEKDKGNGPYLVIRLEPEDISLKDIVHTIMLPREGDRPKQAKNKRTAWRRFLTAFGIDPDEPVEVEQIISLTGWCTVTETDSPEYGKGMKIATWIQPK